MLSHVIIMCSPVSRIAGPGCFSCRSPGWDKERWDWKRSVRPNLRPDTCHKVQGITTVWQNILHHPAPKGIFLTLPYEVPVDFNVLSPIAWKHCLNSGVFWALREILSDSVWLHARAWQTMLVCRYHWSTMWSLAGFWWSLKLHRLPRAENLWTLPLQGLGFREGRNIIVSIIYDELYRYVYIYTAWRWSNQNVVKSATARKDVPGSHPGFRQKRH